MKNIAEQICSIITTLDFSEQVILSKIMKEQNIVFNPYNNPTAVAVAVIPIKTETETRLLSIIRNIAPKIGEIALPGGFVDAHETFEMAAARETFEETGLMLEQNKFKISHSRITPTNNIIVFCNYQEPISEKLIDLSFSNEEVQKIILGDESTSYCFPTHQETANLFWHEFLAKNDTDAIIKE